MLYGVCVCVRCRPAKTVSVNKGVNALDFSPSANIIVTGGEDKVLRLWLPGILREPTAKLLGHQFAIVDIVINDKDQHIISLSMARLISVWDIHSLSLLQVNR